MELPAAKQKTLNGIVEDLKRIDNVQAIVLGGSHCVGMANENSDLDIGIYYHEAKPFSIEDIKRIAKKYNVDDSCTITDFYQWGAWVNGGAWINTSSGEVDFLYKNIEQIKSTIDKAKNGIWQNDFEQQPPYGFSSVIFLAETHYCYPLHDPYNIINELKQEVKNYPVKLKQAIVQQSLWSAQFALWQADKFAAKGDPYNAVGCFTRILKNIVDALYALNELYPLGDKNVIRKIVEMPKCPSNLQHQIENVLATNSKNELMTSAGKLKDLFDQVVVLADGMYQPYFKL